MFASYASNFIFIGFFYCELAVLFSLFREMIGLADGGQFALDWVYNESSSVYSETKPVIILLPGLVGQSLHLLLFQVFTLF